MNQTSDRRRRLSDTLSAMLAAAGVLLTVVGVVTAVVVGEPVLWSLCGSGLVLLAVAVLDRHRSRARRRS